RRTRQHALVHLGFPGDRDHRCSAWFRRYRSGSRLNCKDLLRDLPGAVPCELTSWAPRSLKRGLSKGLWGRSSASGGLSGRLTLNLPRIRIPPNRSLAEVTFIRHMTCNRRMVSEYGVFCHWLSALHCLEKIP